MNIFEQYGIKEVADVTIYAIELDKHDREVYVPVMYLDTLKVSTLEQTADQTTAKGGRGNADLIAWDYGKAIDLNIEDALYTPASQSLMWGGKFGTKKPRVRGLWNPRVYPKDRYGRINYVKRTKLVYGTGGENLASGFYVEDKVNEKDGLELSCVKSDLSFYVGPITNMNALVNDFPAATGKHISAFDQYDEGNWNVYAVDHIAKTGSGYYRDDYRTENFYINLRSKYPDVEIYRKSAKISDSANIGDLNDTDENFYFTFINEDLIAAYEEIQADFKATANKPAEAETFLAKMSNSIKYMKNHKYELGVFSEAHLISSVVKDTFLFMVEKYFKNDFFSRTTYDLNACETAYELYRYSFNSGELKYQDLNNSDYMSKLICPLGYDTLEEKEDESRELLQVYNWSNLSSKLTQSNRPERAEIILDNYGDFEYYNQSMGVTDKYYIGGNYLDVETTSGNQVTYIRKVADTYANNKEFVMSYLDHYTDAVNKGKLSVNPYAVKNDFKILIKKPGGGTYPEGTTLTWSEVVAAANMTYVDGTNNGEAKCYEGTYGTYNGDVQQSSVKNNSAMQAGFFSYFKKMNDDDWNYQVYFNLTDPNYRYPVQALGSYSLVKVPMVLSSSDNSNGPMYRMAQLEGAYLKNRISDEEYQFVSSQFKIGIPSGNSELNNLVKFCVYGKETTNSLDVCTSSKTAHSYIWTDTNLKMVSFEGDQDIYYNEHANLRYRTPQNSSIKEIGIAQQGFYATATTSEYKVKKNISFTFNYYGPKYIEVNGQMVENKSTEIVDLTMSLSAILSDFNSNTNAANNIVAQLKKTTGKTILVIGNHRYGDFTLTDSSALADFIANKCNEFSFGEKPIKYTYGQTGDALSMTVTLYGSIKGDYKWTAINDEEIVSITSLERRFNEKESYGYFIKDYSPIVSFYKTIKTNSTGGNTNLIRVPVGDFYIVSDWNYDGSTEYDYPYAIESGMEDTSVLDRKEKCRASKTFAINTSRNVTMFNYSTIPAYSHTPLTVFIDPRTMKPYEPNADTFTRNNGDVIEGTLRIIKKDEIYYKWTRIVAPDHSSVGRSIIVDAEHFPGTYRIVGETYARLYADGKDQRYQFEIPLAKLSSDTNLTLQADGDPTTFGMKFKVLRKKNGQMMKFTQYTVDNQEYNGYKSGSTKVVAVDASAAMTDNEIAREVNAI